MTDRKRDPLPAGYQFGDARDINPPRTVRVDAEGRIPEQWFAPGLRLRAQGIWRRPSDNAAEQLSRQAVVVTDEGFTANVIEGEPK